jgi:hypothetical protein
MDIRDGHGLDNFTDRARKVVCLARREAERLRHNYIGTEHLLLGLLAEGSGVAACVLRKLGLNIADVRKEMESVVGHKADFLPIPESVMVDGVRYVREKPPRMSPAEIEEMICKCNRVLAGLPEQPITATAEHYRRCSEKPPAPKPDLADELVTHVPTAPDRVRCATGEIEFDSFWTDMPRVPIIETIIRRCIRHAVREAVRRGREAARGTTFAFEPGNPAAAIEEGMRHTEAAILAQVSGE